MSFQPPFAVGSIVTYPEICAASYREVSDLVVKSRLLVSSKPQQYIERYYHTLDEE